MLLPSGHRPYGVVWTDDVVEKWQGTGIRPSVAVWTAEQLSDFLAFIAVDPLYALWWLVALRGLRRGEVAGLRWNCIDFKRRCLYIVSQRTTVGYSVVEGPPKSRRSIRVVALDRSTLKILADHQRQQQAQFARWGLRWREDGYAFLRPDLQPLHPNYLTHRSAFLVRDAGLPPVRLHDLRHGAGSLAQAAGADLKTVSEQLGHASVVLTADTYRTVLPVIQRRAAEATARLVLMRARRMRGKIAAKNASNKPGGSSRPPKKSAGSAPANTRKDHKTAGHKAGNDSGKRAKR